MKKLSKRVNQRIVRLERLTGRTNILAVKELKEKLTIEQLKGVAWTKFGRTAVSSKLTETQMIAEIKALQDFLEGKSTITSVKSEKARVEKSIGKKVSWHAFIV